MKKKTILLTAAVVAIYVLLLILLALVLGLLFLPVAVWLQYEQQVFSVRLSIAGVKLTLWPQKPLTEEQKRKKEERAAAKKAKKAAEAAKEPPQKPIATNTVSTSCGSSEIFTRICSRIRAGSA